MSRKQNPDEERGQAIGWFVIMFIVLMIWFSAATTLYNWDEGGNQLRDALAVCMVGGGLCAGLGSAMFVDWMMKD